MTDKTNPPASTDRGDPKQPAAATAQPRTDAAQPAGKNNTAPTPTGATPPPSPAGQWPKLQHEDDLGTTPDGRRIERADGTPHGTPQTPTPGEEPTIDNALPPGPPPVIDNALPPAPPAPAPSPAPSPTPAPAPTSAPATQAAGPMTTQNTGALAGQQPNTGATNAGQPGTATQGGHQVTTGTASSILSFAMQAFNQLPGLIQAGVNVVSLVTDTRDKLQQMNAENRAPTEQEWAQLDSQVKSLQQQLHSGGTPAG